MRDDAGMREVFRGDLSVVELAAGVLEENGIEFQRRWEQAGGATFAIGETALVPGRAAVLLVPSIAFEEAQRALEQFADPEPDYLTDFTAEVEATRTKRKAFARIVATILLAPIAVWVVVAVFGAIIALFE